MTPMLLVCSMGVMVSHATSKNEEMEIIKTNLKFKRNERGQIQGFVHKKESGSWVGCREEYPVKKKLVIVDEAIESKIIDGVLYQVSLMPTKSDHYFIAFSAKPKMFEGKVDTEVHDGIFRVSVTFGNKTLIYDPDSKFRQRRDIQGIADIIRHSVNLIDNIRIANEFVDSACLLKSMYNRKDK